MKFKIKCYSEKEAIKLLEALDEMKDMNYISYGNISQDGRVVIWENEQ